MSSHPKTLDIGRVRLLAACVLMSGTGYVFAQANKVGFREPPLLKAQPRSVDRVSKALRSGTNLLTAGAEAEAIPSGQRNLLYLADQIYRRHHQQSGHRQA